MDYFRGLAESAKQELARNVRVAMLKLAFGGLGFLAALAAIVFFFAALMTALTERFGELYAELMVGGVLAAVALVLFLLAARVSRRAASPAAARSDEAEAARVAPLPAAIAAFAYGFARGVMRKRR